MIISNIFYWISKFLYHFSAEAEYERYQKRMHDFLSQATDRIHLEQLEREWARRHSSASWR